MPVPRAALLMSVLGAVVGCSASHTGHEDGGTDGASSDAGSTDPDAGPPLPSCGESTGLDLLPYRLSPESARRPSTIPLAMIETPEGGSAVLVYQRWESTEGMGGVRRLLVFDPAGMPLHDLEIHRDALSWSATADIAVVGRELWTVGLDRPTNSAGRIEHELWVARVQPGFGPVRREVLETHSDPEMFDGLAIFADGDVVDVFTLLAGEIQHRRLDPEGGSAPSPVTTDAGFEFSSRLSAHRAGDTTCLVIRERSIGRVTLLRATGNEVEERRVVVASGANFNPPARARDGACEIAYFEASAMRPTEGAIRFVDGAGAATGWAGLHPFGMTFGDDANGLLVATWDPEWAGQTAIYSFTLDEERCSVPEPLLRIDAQPMGGLPLGAVMRAGDFVALAELTGPGGASSRWRDSSASPD